MFTKSINTKGPIVYLFREGLKNKNESMDFVQTSADPTPSKVWTDFFTASLCNRWKFRGVGLGTSNKSSS